MNLWIQPLTKHKHHFFYTEKALYSQSNSKYLPTTKQIQQVYRREKVPDQHWQQAGPGLDLKQVGGEQARPGQGRFSTLRLVPTILLNDICIVHYFLFNAKKNRLYIKIICSSRTLYFNKLLISHHFQERPYELPNE